MTEYKTGDKFVHITCPDGAPGGHAYEYVSKILVVNDAAVRRQLGHLLRYKDSDNFIAYTGHGFSKEVKPWREPQYPFKLGDRIKLKEADVSDNLPVYTVMEVKDDGNVILAFIGAFGTVTQAHSHTRYADTWELVDGHS